MKIETLWDNLVDYSIATGEELQLVTKINGYSENSLNDVLYVRTGYRSWEQYQGENEEDEDEEE
jgi:hypothetical protein